MMVSNNNSSVLMGKNNISSKEYKDKDNTKKPGDNLPISSPIKNNDNKDISNSIVNNNNSSIVNKNDTNMNNNNSSLLINNNNTNNVKQL